MKDLNIEFANFVCHVGERNLLESYLDFVHPAFFNKHERHYGESRCFFYNPQLLEVIYGAEDESIPFVFGRLVKDTFLEREQVYLDGELKDDPTALQNSPSSIFILSLKDHQLFFIKEHKFAPSLDTFRACIERFISEERDALIEDIYQAEKEKYEFRGKTGRKKTKKDLNVTYGKPEVNIIPLSSDADIEEFIKSFKVIDKISLDLVTPNNESDSNPFFESWRKKKKTIPNSKSTVTFSKDKKSLPPSPVADLAKEAADDRNILLKVVGKDIHDDKLVGTNESFKLTVPLGEHDDDPILLTKKVYERFQDLVKDGIVRGPRITDIEKVKEKIKYLLDIIKR
ncbi:hypothetical protein [Bowmanella denitrificans]|uniref:hypothetical protein n=1 Tax=Bowmanella denitrificans TaxID=366582 RepID=UPI000C9AE45F|nr:hypothetical protein [Bowmanella denitrificans]